MMVGSLAVFGLLGLLSLNDLGTWGGALSMFIAALMGTFALRLLPWELMGSPWRVPRSWGRMGLWKYSLLFGFSLGTGVLTALPAPGFYVLVCAIVADAGAANWLVVAILFSAGRWIAVAATSVAVVSGRPGRLGIVDRAASVATSGRWLEGGLLLFMSSFGLTQLLR